jgi:hypothetical protein
MHEAFVQNNPQPGTKAGTAGCSQGAFFFGSWSSNQLAAALKGRLLAMLRCNKKCIMLHCNQTSRMRDP